MTTQERKHEIIRDILLTMASKPGEYGDLKPLTNETPEELAYCRWLLLQTPFVLGDDRSDSDEKDADLYGLTERGRELAELTRDKARWQKAVSLDLPTVHMTHIEWLLKRPNLENYARVKVEFTVKDGRFVGTAGCWHVVSDDPYTAMYLEAADEGQE